MHAEPFSDWLRKRVGSNWVLARRTRRIMQRYGPDAVCLSPKRYAALMAEYKAAQRALLAKAIVHQLHQHAGITLHPMHGAHIVELVESFGIDA